MIFWYLIKVNRHFLMLISIKKLTQSYTLQFTLSKDKSIKFFPGTLNTFIYIPGLKEKLSISMNSIIG